MFACGDLVRAQLSKYLVCDQLWYPWAFLTAVHWSKIPGQQLTHPSHCSYDSDGFHLRSLTPLYVDIQENRQFRIFICPLHVQCSILHWGIAISRICCQLPGSHIPPPLSLTQLVCYHRTKKQIHDRHFPSLKHSQRSRRENIRLRLENLWCWPSTRQPRSIKRWIRSPSDLHRWRPNSSE